MTHEPGRSGARMLRRAILAFLFGAFGMYALLLFLRYPARTNLSDAVASSFPWDAFGAVMFGIVVVLGVVLVELAARWAKKPAFTADSSGRRSLRRLLLRRAVLLFFVAMIGRFGIFMLLLQCPYVPLALDIEQYSIGRELLASAATALLVAGASVPITLVAERLKRYTFKADDDDLTD